MYLFFSV